jgi:heavy metal translocating P-type ATPase
MQKQKSLACALCSCTIFHPILDETKQFCCAGCQTVYHILLSRNELTNFRETSLFQQAVRSGLISNPALLTQIQEHQASFQDSLDKFEKLHLEIGDMWCPSCAEVICLILFKEKGVRHCIVDYATDLACIEFYPRYISKEKILGIIQGIGYRPLCWPSTQEKPVSKDLYLRFLVAAFFSMNIMMFSYPIYASYFYPEEIGSGKFFAWLSFFASVPILWYSGWPIFVRFWYSLKVGIAGMEALIVIGVSAAFGLSCLELFRGSNYVYFDSMSVIIAFVLLGKIIEAKAKFSTKECLFRLQHSFPKRGRKKFSNGAYHFVPLKEIAVNDVISVLTGEKIVLDGIVVEGSGACDESLMTGEVMPVKKDIHSPVLAGTFLKQGWLAFRVTANSADTMLQKIITIVEKDIEHKTVYFRAVEPIVRGFVPLVLLLAFAVSYGAWLKGDSIDSALVRAISILLISCPCAIGIAAPLAESHLLGAFLNLGAIVRNRGCLPLFGKETVFVFDKTGTVTMGRFHIIKGLDDLSVEQKEILKGLVSFSNHPIACAIASSIQVHPRKLSFVQEVVGRGIEAEYQGKQVLLGSAAFMKLKGLKVETRDPCTTEVYFAVGNKVFANLLLGDQIREEAPSVIKALSRTILLSGDSESTVKIVAEKCGFGEWRAGYSPLEKREFIDQLRKSGEVVCMVGDGINDAPALTASSVSISVMTAADVSVQVSDILLTNERLSTIINLRKLSKKGHKIIYQNIFWAFFYNVVGIGLAVAGYMHPIFAAFAMVASSLIVLFNAQRIRFKSNLR